MRTLRILGVATALTVAACGTESLTDVPADYLLETANADAQPVGTYVRVCKLSYNDLEGLPDDGTLGTPFTFATTANGGTVTAPTASMPATSFVQLNRYVDCPVVWEDPSTTFDDQTQVTITELDAPGFELAEIFYEHPSDGIFRGYDRMDGTSATLTPRDGLIVYFKNSALDVPPPSGGGGEGCTPGYWRQIRHWRNWTGYHPFQSYRRVFNAGFPVRLITGAWMKGGHYKALTRHSVAALLNASHPDIDYDLTTDEVIALVQQAFATRDWETAKDRLAQLNQQGCPLN